MLRGAANCDEMRAFSSMVNRSRTPCFHVAHGACASLERDCRGYVCHVNAGVTDVGTVFAELVQFHKWTAVNVLYDNSAGMVCLYTTQGLLLICRVRHTFCQRVE